MTKKIILVFLLASVCTTSGCGFWDWLKKIFGGGGCGISYCCPNGQPGTPFIAVYRDGTSRSGTRNFEGKATLDRRSPGGTQYECSEIAIISGNNFGFALTASPSSVDLNAVPASVTIAGQALDGTYGMPRMDYFDSSGYLIGSTTATAVASDGSWLTAPVPDLSSAYSGTFQIQVTNMRSDGEYLDIVGSATISCWGRNRPDSDGDGFYDDEDCYPYDPSLWCGGGGGGGDDSCGVHACTVY